MTESFHGRTMCKIFSSLHLLQSNSLPPTCKHLPNPSEGAVQASFWESLLQDQDDSIQSMFHLYTCSVLHDLLSNLVLFRSFSKKVRCGPGLNRRWMGAILTDAFGMGSENRKQNSAPLMGRSKTARSFACLQVDRASTGLQASLRHVGVKSNLMILIISSSIFMHLCLTAPFQHPSRV